MKKYLLTVFNYLGSSVPIEKINCEGYFLAGNNWKIRVDVTIDLSFFLIEYIVLKMIQYFAGTFFNTEFGSLFFLIVPLPIFYIIEVGLSELDFTKFKYFIMMFSRALIKSLLLYITDLTLGNFLFN